MDLCLWGRFRKKKKKHRMKINFPPYLILFFFSSYMPFISSANSAKNPSTQCPIDFNYVTTFPWDTQQCRGNDQKSCRQTLLSLVGMGLSTYLNKTSMFYLSDSTSASSCVLNFRTQLSTLSINQTLVSLCLNPSSDLVNKPTSCDGIQTTSDWIEKVGSTSSSLVSSCSGDLRGLAKCGSCVDAGMKINSDLVHKAPNSTHCFYFIILYAAGVVNQLGPQDTATAACILGLPLSSGADGEGSSSNDHFGKESMLKVVFSLFGAIIGVLVFIGLVLSYRACDRKRKQRAAHDKIERSMRSQISPNVGATWFRISDLQQATDGFSQKNFIGQGGYGVVYKGKLKDGSTVAVKQILNDLDSQEDEEFSNEVELISKIRHRNLLPLRGCCVSSDDHRGKTRYLVYEFMSNGSLADHLFHNMRPPLTWPQRKNIMLDVAKGLAYLHYGVRPAIYHRDIKGTNILLDSEMKAMVGDFGLVKQSREGGQSHLTTRVCGTYGYLAPEYALYGQLTEKSDVYSFGIVILETISGRKVLDTSDPSAPLLITDLAWTLVKAGRVEEMFDDGIREEGPKGIMERFVHVGILCAHVMVALRPTITQALKMLEGDIDIPRLPDRPLPSC